MKKSTWLCIGIIALLIPGTLYLGTQMDGKGYYLICTMVILETMLPFFLAFERRKPHARELVTIAVLCALAVASRVLIVVPGFKPTTAIIMLTGIALGPEAGFMTGAVTAFASNFFFTQGPWTPWQMMGYGIGGFLSGMLFYGRKRPAPTVLTIYGFGMILLIVGPLLDLCTVFTTGGRITWKYTAAVMFAGLLPNLKHAAACALTMLLLSKPLLDKLERLKRKYGMLEDTSAVS